MRLGLGLLAVSALLWFFNLQLTLPGVNFVRAKLYQTRVEKALDLAPAEKAIFEAEILNLKQENERLRDLLGAPLSPGWQFLPVQVLDLNDDEMTLAVGAKGGVRFGQTVIGYLKENLNNGVVLGAVTEVLGSQSRVKLLLSPEIQVKAKSASGANGLVSGDGTSIWLDQVVQADRLLAGELVFTSGGDGFLPGLVLGRVGEVVKDEAAIYQRARVIPVIDSASLVNVYIVSD